MAEDGEMMETIGQGPERRFTIRPLGGTLGCLGMILFSLLASVVLTLVANALLR